jgi:hypothetical protein
MRAEQLKEALAAEQARQREQSARRAREAAEARQREEEAARRARAAAKAKQREEAAKVFFPRLSRSRFSREAAEANNSWAGSRPVRTVGKERRQIIALILILGTIIGFFGYLYWQDAARRKRFDDQLRNNQNSGQTWR